VCRKIITRYNRPKSIGLCQTAGAEKTRPRLFMHDVAILWLDSEAEIDGQSTWIDIRSIY